MFERMKASLPEFKDDLRKKGVSYSQFEQSIDEKLNEYEREIDTGQTPVQSFQEQNKTPSVEQHLDKSTSDADDEETDLQSRPRSRKPRLGSFCGDVYGRRYCPMLTPMPLGSQCTCSNFPGWGLVVR
jgi:hypothetical protein